MTCFNWGFVEQVTQVLSESGRQFAYVYKSIIKSELFILLTKNYAYLFALIIWRHTLRGRRGRQSKKGAKCIQLYKKVKCASFSINPNRWKYQLALLWLPFSWADYICLLLLY
jgi:hypothetical protein